MSDITKKKENLNKSVNALEKSVSSPILEDRDISGIIKDFEIAYELSWKLLKSLLEDNGLKVFGPKDVFNKAFQNNFIKNEKVWINMIRDRNLTVHTYNQEFVEKLMERIREEYLPVLKNLNQS